LAERLARDRGHPGAASVRRGAGRVYAGAGAPVDVAPSAEPARHHRAAGQVLEPGSMSGPRVVAVGAPPTFRQQVARALGAAPESVEWVPTVTAAEDFLTDGRAQADLLALSPS